MGKKNGDKLVIKITEELKKSKPNVDNIINIINSQQTIDYKNLEKVKRDKKIDLNKINGALKQCINAHGPITKELIGSASKRIYGALMLNTNAKKIGPLSIRDMIIGSIITTFIFLIFNI